MIFCQMTLNSPNNKQRTALSDLNSNQLVHLAARQLSTARILHDDLVYSKLILSKIIILGQLVSAQKETTQRGMAILNIKLQDSTGYCNIKMYQSQFVNHICSQIGSYLKVAATVKCGGLAYRPQIRIMGTSIKVIEDFNQITEHFLQCAKTAIMAEL